MGSIFSILIPIRIPAGVKLLQGFKKSIFPQTVYKKTQREVVRLLIKYLES